MGNALAVLGFCCVPGRGRRYALALVGAIAASTLWPTSAALAQQCATTGTNQTCTNSVAISGGANGINDTATLTLTNTATGAVTGAVIGVNAITANVTNSGTITGGTLGIFAFTANVTNSGTITGGNTGILAATAANVSNSGAITGGNTGINASTANVRNSGTITGGFIGIAVTTGTVTNSGTISGPLFAIRFTGVGADTLTLLPGSSIIGAIQLNGFGDTINFRVGNQNLTFDTLAGATVTSTVPFVVSGNRVVTIDPTPFAVAGMALGDFTRSVSAVVPVFDNLPTTGGATATAFAAPTSPAPIFSPAFDGIPGLSAYAADHAAFKAPTVMHADGTTFWARGFAGQRIQQADGVILRNVNNFFGGAMGMDRLVSPNLRIGGFIGAGSTRSSIELNSGDTDSNLGFGGLYARYLWGASFLHAAVQGGGSRNDTTRNINNNLAAGGLETAKASYNGWYVSPELTLGHRIALGHVLGAQHTLTPSLQVRYLYGSFGSYTETGSTANLTVNGQTVQTFEERAELKLTRFTLLNPTSALLVHLTGGALGVQRVGGNTVNAVLLGQAIPFATPGKDDVWGGYGGFGMEFRHANVAVFLSGEYLALNDDSSVVTGKGGLRVVF
jgi:autotransporter-like protein